MKKSDLISLTILIFLLPSTGYFFGEQINDKMITTFTGVTGKILDDKIFVNPSVEIEIINVLVNCEGEYVMIISDPETNEVLSRCQQNPELSPDEYRTDEWRAMKEICKDGKC